MLIGDYMNSVTWWAKTKADPDAFHTWLTKQYIGECTAEVRIRNIAKMANNPIHSVILDRIADDEAKHAEWVADLLMWYKVALPVIDIEASQQRYWKEVLPSISSVFDAYAVGAHAETMRLSRIQAIVDDTAKDPYYEKVWVVFSGILPDEQFHAKAFAVMAGPEALSKNLPNHQRGLEVLGLES